MSVRKVIQTVGSTRAGPFHRLVGSLDFKGQGTKHELESVDPVVLCDDGGVHVGPGLPPFGLHPHAGLVAISLITDGKFMDMDNINGESKELNEAGGVYVVSSGRGVAHMEKTASEGGNRLIQTIVQIPKSELHHEPEHKKAKAADLPVLKLKGGQVTVCVGKLGETQSPATVRALPRFVLGRALVNPGSTVDLPVDPDLLHGYVYVLEEGKGCIVDEKNEKQCDLFQGSGAHIFGGQGTLRIKNDSDSDPLDLFVAAGKPLNEPWKKLLGYNGFILADNEENAQKVMDTVSKVGVENFTFKCL